MPRNVRNFWLTLNVDGRETPIAAGPVGKDGGFTLKIEQRDAGNIVHTLTMGGYVRDDGTITLRAFQCDDKGMRDAGKDSILIETRR